MLYIQDYVRHYRLHFVRHYLLEISSPLRFMRAAQI